MTAAEAPAPHLFQRIRRQLADLARLAGPTIVARAGILTMVLADVVMVGRFGTDDLAYVSLGSSIFVPLLVAGVGLMIGVTAMTAQTYGAGRERDCGAIWIRALPFALAIGAISATICFFGEPILRLFGQTDIMASEGGAVARVLAPGLLGYSFFVASTFFLEGIRRPGPGMIAMLAANVLNVFLNWVLIFGNLGFPAMGAVGSGITTSIVRTFLGVAIVVYILRMRDGARFGIDGVPGPRRFVGWWSNSVRTRRIGYAGGVATAAQNFSLAAMTQFAGLLGVVPVAAYSIAFNAESVMFMVALGIGAATGVLVGNAWGRGNVAEARLAGWVGLFTTVAVMGVCGLAIGVLGQPIAEFYSNDPTVVAAAVPLMALVGVVIVADGAQLTVAQSVRSLGDTWAAAGCNVIAFLGVMVPLGWYLAFTRGAGAAGLLVAVLVGCGVALLLQAARFHVLLRRGP